ncbi:hypothetical protein [Mesorhizobium sp. M00.F.Ca.ET.216.01.1.1]|uniref:hypothetical protein n=1 Tax=Mesorhizobium sp. M00.F.Ca.ET.216.01.1.1 TaxID=2500528 RepID=UPI000FDC001C|nr:hypothetical protein [Mesorhizobium sp. M00.F.Ca.ET.216.01.1.1]TGQ34653.1 hypothetical protein EN859_024745 [Mesorhizobium sp. M00.F.Ca.ET.216.01.1.1]
MAHQTRPTGNGSVGNGRRDAGEAALPKAASATAADFGSLPPAKPSAPKKAGNAASLLGKKRTFNPIEATRERSMNPQVTILFPPFVGGCIMGKPGISVSALDCDILRSAFINSLIEERIPEDQWREYAALLIREFTGSDDVDSDLLDWIVRSSGATQP